MPPGGGGNHDDPQQKLLNVSTRVRVYKDNSVMIGGFIISGQSQKQIVLRAIGPSLIPLGVEGALKDPILDVYDSSGTVIAENDDWTSLPPDSIPSGFAPTDPKESLIVETLPAGGYTAVLRGTDGSSGVALVELYDLDPNQSTIVNLSTRGQVGTGDDVLIGGFIISGENPTRVMLRAIGPELLPYGITNALLDPVLELHGPDGSIIYQNDNWRSDQEQQILDTTLAPLDDRESAIVATLPPAKYTAIVRGANGSSGVALVELYNLEPAP